MDFQALKKSAEHLKKYMPLTRELVIRDLKVKYRRSLLGYLWSLLNPLMMMTVMSIVFSYMFKSNIENFPLYLICGQTLWTFFNESTSMSMYSIINNGNLIKKVYIPKFIFPISRVLSSFVTMSFSLTAILIVMLFTRATFYWTILLFFIPLAFLFLFCCGVSMILASLATQFRDVTHLYSVLTLAWMYLTPVFYPVAALPKEIAVFINANPMTAFITFFRELVLYGAIPMPTLWIQCVVWSVGALGIGLIVFKKMQKDFILYV